MIKKKYVLVSRYNFNDNFRSANFVSHFFLQKKTSFFSFRFEKLKQAETKEL